jgi:Recombinase
MPATALRTMPAAGQAAGGDTLSAWAERTGRPRVAEHGRAGLRFAFYGRVSTEDWQDPVTSLARQRDQAATLVAGRGHIVAEFFDIGQSRALAWARRLRAAAMVAELADPDRGWDAIVIGEYERAFCGGQYASMAPLFEHYGVQLWTPEVGGRSAARITRALNDAGIPCQSAADPKRNPHRTGTAWTLSTVAAILANPRYTGRQVWNRQRTDSDLVDPSNTGLGHRPVQRWNLPAG